MIPLSVHKSFRSEMGLLSLCEPELTWKELAMPENNTLGSRRLRKGSVSDEQEVMGYKSLWKFAQVYKTNS